MPDVAAEQTAPGGRLGRDLAMTMLTQVAIGLGGLFVYRLIALEKHAEGVAAYSLVKQLAVFVWPVTMLGLHTAIPRSVALVRDRAGSRDVPPRSGRTDGRRDDRGVRRGIHLAGPDGLLVLR